VDNTETSTTELKYNKETEIKDLIYERDTNYDIKEIMYYKYCEIPNSVNLINELENIKDVENSEVLKEEIKNIINNFFKYENNDNNNGNNNKNIKYLRDASRNKIINKLNDKIVIEMKYRYGENYNNEDLKKFY